jgi:hypothetical protein
MTEQQLTALQAILGEATRNGTIPVELTYVYSVALCVLQQQMEVYNESIVKEYGTRLHRQLEAID